MRPSTQHSEVVSRSRAHAPMIAAEGASLAQRGHQAVERHNERFLLEPRDPPSADDAYDGQHPARITPALACEPTRRVDRPHDVRAAIAQRLGLDHEAHPRWGAQHVVKIPAAWPVHRVGHVPALACERFERSPDLRFGLGADATASGQARRTTAPQPEPRSECSDYHCEPSLTGARQQRARRRCDRGVSGVSRRAHEPAELLSTGIARHHDAEHDGGRGVIQAVRSLRRGSPGVGCGHAAPGRGRCANAWQACDGDRAICDHA